MAVSESLESNIFSNPKYLWRRLIQIVADLRLAIILLLVIAVFSMSGTVIEQG